MTSATVEAVGGSTKEKGKNIYVLGLIARMFELDVPKLAPLLKERFAGKSEDIVRNAMLAFDAGYAYPAENLRACLFRLEKAHGSDGTPQVTSDGNSPRLINKKDGWAKEPNHPVIRRKLTLVSELELQAYCKAIRSRCV